MNEDELQELEDLRVLAAMLADVAPIEVPTKVYHYAELDEKSVCYSESWLSGEVDQPNMILLSDDAPSPIGKKYINGEWFDLPPEPQPIPESELLLTEIALNSEYLVCLAEINNL